MPNLKREFDLSFFGNGILTYVSALKVKKQFPELSIAVIGPKNKTYSASVAAGAMQAVFCEVEDTFNESKRDREIFDVGLEARPLWVEFLSTFGMKNVIVAESTIMYSRKEGTPFEIANFKSACAVASDHKCIEDVSKDELDNIFCGNIKSSSLVAKKFVGEFSIDPNHFFNLAQDILEKMGVVFIDAKIQKLNREANGVSVLLSNNESIQSKKAIVAAGSESGHILPKELPMVPIYHAVGTAMILDSAPSSYANLKYVVRTPNRGGAQCGMHIVPRNQGKFYLGAGNYLSDREPAHRIETIRYLTNICEDELFGKQVIYNAKAELLLGSRPKSMDGFPIVGSWKEFPELFVMSGMYRIALTIAPVVANEVCQWVKTGEASVKFKNWAPSRQLHSYSPLEVASRYYSESRISNLIEHGLLDAHQPAAIAAKKIELESVALKLNSEVVARHKLPANFVIDPDMYALLVTAEPKN